MEKENYSNYSISLKPNEALTLKRCVDSKKWAKEPDALPVTINVALGGNLHGIEDELWRDRFFDVNLEVLDIWFDEDNFAHLVARFKPFNAGVLIVTDVEPGLDKTKIRDFKKVFKGKKLLSFSSYKQRGKILAFSNITNQPFGICMVGETLGVIRSDPGKS